MHEICKVGAAREGESRCSAVSGDGAQFFHHGAHPWFSCRDKKHGEVVDAKMVVDRACGDYLAIGEYLAANDRLDGLGAHIGLKCVVAITQAKERVGFDPFGSADGVGYRDAQRFLQEARGGGRGLDDVDVADELRVLVLACADLDVERDVGCHMVVCEPDDAGGSIAVPADPRREYPFGTRNDPFGDEQLRGVAAEMVYLVDREIVREFYVLAETAQPFALFMKKLGEALARLHRIPAVVCDELLRGQLRMPAQGFEDAVDVIVGDRSTPAARRAGVTCAILAWECRCHRREYIRYARRK